MSFADMLNQKVDVERQTGDRDLYGDKGYVETKDVDARVEKRLRQVLDRENRPVLSDTVIFLEMEVTANDKIDGRPIINVYDMVDGDGTVIGYEVVL